VRFDISSGSALFLIILCLLLAACGPQPPIEPTPSPQSLPSQVQVVEVTRIVTQPVLFSPTPLPPTPCAIDKPVLQMPIALGAILPLSLPGNMLAGFAMQTSLNIAISEINERGGIDGSPLRLVTYDSAGQADRATIFAERLVLQDCVVAIVGGYHNDVSMAVSDVANRYSIPFLITEAVADELTARMPPAVFRISAAQAQLAAMPADWLAAVGDYNQDGKIVAVLLVDSQSQKQPWLVQARQAFANHQIQVEVLQIDLPGDDFSSTVARVVAMEQLPDAIFIYVKGSAAMTFQAQILAAGIGPSSSTIIINNHAALEWGTFWQRIPDGVNTVVARVGPWRATVTPQGLGFARKYEQYANRWPDAFSFATYDAIYLITDAIRRARSLNGADLIIAIENSDITISSGHYVFPYGSSNPIPPGSPDYLWHQWPTPQMIYLQYTSPQQAASEMAVLWPEPYQTTGGPIIR
jgi:branched-chain amino acid transport system substrate-binding protein